MKRICLIVAVLLQTLLAVPLSAQPEARILQRLDSVFQDWKPEEPGGAVAVIKSGTVIFRKAFGRADVARNKANTPETRFDLASNAKQFTAMCIALLDEQGKLSLEDDITKYYPGLRISERIRIRNLIDHTSGLRDASVLAILSGKMNLKGEVRKRYNTKEYYLECLMRETDLNYPPGTQFVYNNFNYVLLGDIVEKVSGKTLAEFSDSAIFKPLGMANTEWRDRRDAIITNSAEGYLFRNKKFKKREGLGGIVGDHNLFSTIDDLVRWQNNFRQNKLGNASPLMIEKFCRSSKLNNAETTSYGFGVWNGKYKELIEIGHGGDDGRQTSVLKRFPEHDLSIIVLANSSRFDDIQAKAYAIADIILAQHLTPAERETESFTFIQLSSDELKSREGIYTRVDEHGLGHIVRIRFDDGKLFVTRNYSWKGLELSAVSKEYFIARNPEGQVIRIKFSEDSGGTVLSETFRTRTQHYSFRQELSASYQDFKGKYVNKSTGATIKIKHNKNNVAARKGILKIPLIPFATDQLYAPENLALFTFQRNSRGEITGFLANAYDFRNFKFEKVKRRTAFD